LEAYKIQCSLIAFIAESLLNTSAGNIAKFGLDPLLALLESESENLMSQQIKMSSLHLTCRNILITLKSKSIDADSGLFAKAQIIGEFLSYLQLIPCSYPRYFFQSRPTTSIKISTSPTPKITGDLIAVSFNSELILRISGIIITTSKVNNRKIKQIVLNIVTSIPTAIQQQKKY